MAEKAECGSSTSQIEARVARVEGCYRVSVLAEDCVKAASRCVNVLLRLISQRSLQ